MKSTRQNKKKMTPILTTFDSGSKRTPKMGFQKRREKSELSFKNIFSIFLGTTAENPS